MTVLFVILAIIVLGIGVTIILRQRFSIRGRALDEAVRKAFDSFNSFSNRRRFSPISELNDYKETHTPLFNTIVEFRSRRYIAPNAYALLDVERFISFFTQIDEYHDENNRLYNHITESDRGLYAIAPVLDKYFDTDHYFTYSEKEDFISSNKEAIADFLNLFPKYREDFAYPTAELLYERLLDLEKSRKTHNVEFTETQLRDNNSFFDTIFKYPLDAQQRKAIVQLEDNVLVTSSAGSGKTSTIIGKAKYLLDIRKTDPSKILIVTYTKKAANELCERLGNLDVDCCTFHSLAYKIVAHVENKRPSICDQSLLLKTFYQLIQSDKEFLASVLHYILHLQSLMKPEHEYEHAAEYFNDRKKYGIQAPYTDMDGKIIFTRSEEEKKICTLLTELGVDFVYEQPYERPTYTEDYRQYRPDFTIYVKEAHTDPLTNATTYRYRCVYLEHFAIDAAGNVPKWFGDKDPVGGWFVQNKRYREGIEWKRSLHRKYNTILIETTSADFHSGRILEVLMGQLKKAGVPFCRVPDEQLYERLVKRFKKIESSVLQLLVQFITLAKANHGSLQPALDKAIAQNDNRTIEIIQKIVKPIYTKYTEELVKRGEMDFIDTINKATKYCAAGAWKTYEHILVDEFQDMSYDRCCFLQYLRAKSPLTKLFCVGDDWQSIYRFAGSDINLHYRFDEFFGYTEYCDIEKTYRFCNPLLDISNGFIQSNPKQKRKTVVSNAPEMPQAVSGMLPFTEELTVEGKKLRFRREDIPAVEYWLKNHRTYIDFIDCGRLDAREPNMLRSVSLIISNIAPDETILIIGRYNHDLKSLGYTGNTNEMRGSSGTEINIGGRKIKFMSVHTAKGLEADNVILINCDGGIYGFPSLIEDDPILEYLLSDMENYEHAEERRLFYVAITRAKKHTYVLYHTDKASPFVKELTETVETRQMVCPLCRIGHIITAKYGIANNGNKYTNYCCSNANAGCDYFERVFEGNTPRFIKFNANLRARGQ